MAVLILSRPLNVPPSIARLIWLPVMSAVLSSSPNGANWTACKSWSSVRKSLTAILRASKMADSLQSTMVNVKTVLPVEDVRRKVMSLWPSCIFVAATHDEPGKVKHCHCVVRFEVPTRWNLLRQWLETHDPHNYSKPARSWRRSVRYLLHLDNPDKSRIPRAALVSDGIDEDELEQLLGSQSSRF